MNPLWDLSYIVTYNEGLYVLMKTKEVNLCLHKNIKTLQDAKKTFPSYKEEL